MITTNKCLSAALAYVAGAVLLIAILLEVDVAADRSVQSGRDADRTEVERTINNVLGWAVTKDFNLFFGTIADDSDFISVTPYKRVKFGVEDVKKDTAFWSNPGFKAIRHELHNLKIKFSNSGEVAWFYCVLDDINELDGQPANWENVRWTGVVEKRQGKWRVVQQHFSYAQ